MRNKVTAVILVLMLALSFNIAASAGVQANPHIASAQIVLSSSMYTTFTCSCHDYYNISAYSVKLETKNIFGIWVFVCNLPSPAGVTNASILFSGIDYSAYCTLGKTYRITATFDASGETVSRTSAAITYR